MTRTIAITLAAAALAACVAGSGRAANCNSKHAPAICKHHAKPKPKAPPAPATLVARISLGAPTFDLVDGFGSLWARVGTDTSNGGDTIERIDPATNAVVAKIVVGKGFGLAIGDGSLWAPNFVAETLTRIDPTTNGIVATIPLPDVGAATVSTTPGAVWVGTKGPEGLPGVMIHIDTRTNSVVATSALLYEASYTAVGANFLWVVDGNQLQRFDPATGRGTVLPVTVANQTPCGGIAADDTSVWIAGGTCGFPRFSFEKINPTTGGVAAQLQIPQAVDVTIGLGAVWATTTAGTLVRVDETTGKLASSMKTDLGPRTAIHAGAGAIWVADATTGALERFSPK